MDETSRIKTIDHLVRQRAIQPRRPKKVADVLSRLIARRGYIRGRESGQLGADWASIVGPAIAARTRPGTVRRGVLTVSVTDAILVQELTFGKKDIIARLNAQDPERAIRNIRFKLDAVE